MNGGGTLRTSLRRLFSLTSSETTLVKSSETSSSSSPVQQPLNKVLVVGLGNYPAPRSRHSVGQHVLHCIADKNALTLSYKRNCKAHLARFTLNECEVFLLKPKHYMNLNGKSVAKALSVYQISPQNVLLLHDELDLPLGKFKVKHGGSANGHNGVIDTHERLKYTGVKRLRIGIGRPSDKADVMDYVLADFNKNERSLLNAMQNTLVDTVYQTISIMTSPQDTQECHVTKLNDTLDNLPEFEYPVATPSPQWTPPSPRKFGAWPPVDRQCSETSQSTGDTLGTIVMLGALHKGALSAAVLPPAVGPAVVDLSCGLPPGDHVCLLNYNNSRGTRDHNSTPGTPRSPGRRRFSNETVPNMFPYDDLDVRKDYNKRESKIEGDCNKRIDYRKYRRDRRDSDSSRE